MVTVGATIVFAVSGAAWRLGSRLGAVEKGLAVCESDIRNLNRKVDRILERLLSATRLADSHVAPRCVYPPD